MSIHVHPEFCCAVRETSSDDNKPSTDAVKLAQSIYVDTLTIFLMVICLLALGMFVSELVQSIHVDILTISLMVICLLALGMFVSEPGTVLMHWEIQVPYNCNGDVLVSVLVCSSM